MFPAETIGESNDEPVEKRRLTMVGAVQRVDEILPRAFISIAVMV